MAKKSFESALDRLEKITDELEEGELPLDTSLKRFAEGVKLVDYCHQQLTEAKAKVELLLDKDGELKNVPFDGDDDGNNSISSK